MYTDAHNRSILVLADSNYCYTQQQKRKSFPEIEIKSNSILILF